MTDKTVPEGFNKRQATEDDVEGHRFVHAPDGISRRQVTETDGISRRQATEDDVEGHLSRQRVDGEGFARVKADGEGFAHAKADGADDDVEGHSLLDPFAARELARARERDVQQHAKRHEFERDARDAKKDRS